jgi:hypothetical protein
MHAPFADTIPGNFFLEYQGDRSDEVLGEIGSTIFLGMRFMGRIIDFGTWTDDF